MTISGLFWLFVGVVGLFHVALGVVTFVVAVRRNKEHHRILQEGHTAQAQCQEVSYVHHTSSTGQSHSERRQVVAFWTGDGRPVRTKVATRIPCAPGEIVPVRYLPERPDRAVSARDAPAGSVLNGVLGAMMVLLTCFGLAVTAVGFGMLLF
ncbi:DUF3592 domain-containing protein [Streptomyces sp. NPDC004111]|uniref:DUF3592 domain-containing protein n=1 Tax=Streptomyces sp. NPDC004111 TaxID=3364690 RepID=UPI0036AB9643